MTYLAKLVRYARFIYWRTKETLQNIDVNLFIVKKKAKKKKNQILLYKLNDKEKKEEIFVECVKTLFITEVRISDKRQWYWLNVHQVG